MEQQDDPVKAKEPIFSRKKTLLTVGQYASHQGVSAGIVQEAAKLGMVQVRKHKDKTYIVDLPLDVYQIARQSDAHPMETVDTESCANKITELVNRIFQPDNTGRNTPADFGNKAETQSGDMPQIQSTGQMTSACSASQTEFSVQDDDVYPGIPDLNLFAQELNELADNKDINEQQLSRFRIPVLRNITESITSLSARKIFLILMATAFAVTIIAYSWVSNDRKIQQQKLRDAYENISNLITKYENERQKARLYELDIINWQSEAQRSQKEIIDYKAELQIVKNSLYEARRDLQNTQMYNMETIRTLNDQINKIRSQVSNTSGKTVE